MARRATYFFDIHKTTAPRLLVSGAWEYMRPGSSGGDPHDLASIGKALDIMGYDVGLISKAEARALADAGITPPPWQQTAAQAPFSQVSTREGTIGFMRLPALPRGTDAPDAEMMDRISRDIRKYRKQVRLLVALSDWGWIAEQEYLASEPAAVPDVLLGSGRGSGVNGRIQADGRCLWFRAYDKGRTIAEITILEWPDRENPFAWTPSKNYNSTSTGLNDEIKDYPAVRDALN